MNAFVLISVVSVASAVYDQVSQLAPVQQVDDIDEVHQLDPVHQVDHKDECSKVSLQKRHHNMDQPGFEKTRCKPSRSVILVICLASFHDLFFY